ncbi:ligand-binding sensor domain-containing protein [Ferruginibacter profundus]
MAQKKLQYSFRHITQADGLLHNQVFYLEQDNKGFIWMATLNGLQRYDGSRFTYYPEMLNNPAEGLTPGAEMYSDKARDILWIQKNFTIEKMELAKNRISLFNSGNFTEDSSYHYTRYTDADNNPWFLGDNAVYTLTPGTNKKIIQQQNIVLRDAHKAAYIFTDKLNKQTWVAMLSKVFLFDEQTKKVYTDNFNPVAHPLLQSLLFNVGDYASRYVMVDSRNNVWVTTWGNQLYRYNTTTRKMSTYFLSDTKSTEQKAKASPAGLLVNCMIEDNHGNIWLGTENAGLLRYNREEDNFDYCLAEEKTNHGIQYNYKIFSLLQDKEQNIWIGTDRGISIFNPYRQYFKTIRHEEDNPQSIPKSEIQSFIQLSNGDIYIGTWGNGIGVYDSNFNFKKNILFAGPGENNFVWSFQQMTPDTLWIGCQHGYLNIYNTINGTVTHLHPPEMENFTIRCMEKDTKGNVWFGLQNGKIVKWDKQTGKFLPFAADGIKRLAPVLNIFFDSGQRCWVSTEAGFKAFDTDKRIYTNTWLPDKNNKESISGKTSQGIEEYDDSTLLIGTIYGGINFFNTNTKIFTPLPATAPPSSQTIYAIKKDKAGFIWYTTDFGLYKYNPAEKKNIPYSIEPGIINSSFKANNFFPLLNGAWLTLTTTEAVSFYPMGTEYHDNQQPKIEITGFKILDSSLFIDSLLLDNKPVQLSYKDNFITIEFAALRYLSLQQTNYYYRLAGLEKNWVNGGARRFANYTGLQPGEYQFEVKAEIGNTSSAITTFKIIITPPFWQTLWFKLLCLVVIGGFIYLLAKWRINSIYKEGKRKMHFTRLMAEMEMKALRSQMNPHFIFNCINSIDALIQSNDKYHATVYLNKFAKLLRNILDTNKYNTVPFSKDIDTLKLYVELEELRHENKFKPTFKIDHELLNSDYKVPPLIIQPFVENAILHGLKNRDDNNGILSIDIKKVNDKIQYIITDNGIGRVASAAIMQNKESHYGMQISYDRIKLFNKEEVPSVVIKDLYSNGIACGTEVTVNLNIV